MPTPTFTHDQLAAIGPNARARCLDIAAGLAHRLRDKAAEVQLGSDRRGRCICGETACESELCDCDSSICPVDHAADEAQQPEVEARPQRVQCSDCGAVGPVITADDGLAYLDRTGQIGHHPQAGAGGAHISISSQGAPENRTATPCEPQLARTD